jgi:hypothetical protein
MALAGAELFVVERRLCVLAGRGKDALEGAVEHRADVTGVQAIRHTDCLDR